MSCHHSRPRTEPTVRPRFVGSNGVHPGEWVADFGADGASPVSLWEVPQEIDSSDNQASVDLQRRLNHNEVSNLHSHATRLTSFSLPRTISPDPRLLPGTRTEALETATTCAIDIGTGRKSGRTFCSMHQFLNLPSQCILIPHPHPHPHPRPRPRL